MPDHKQTFSIVVNGNPVTVEANENAPLRSIIERALHEGGVVGQPPDNWEMRDEVGNVLDLAKKIGTFGFPIGVSLFLSLKAGAAG